MQQVLLNIGTGETRLIDAPIPALEAGQKSLIKSFRLQTKEYTEKGRILRNAFSNLLFDLRTKKRILESPSKV
jgi:hypothetical protein